MCAVHGATKSCQSPATLAAQICTEARMSYSSMLQKTFWVSTLRQTLQTTLWWSHIITV